MEKEVKSITIPKIVVVGSSNTDLVIITPRIPSVGETIIGGDFIMASGGKGANQAVAAARLGAEVTFVARVGIDMFGERAIQDLRNNKVDTSYVARDSENPSGVAMIFVDREGDNVIIVAPGSNGKLSPEDVSKAEEAIESADILLLQLEIPLDTVEYAVDKGHESNVKVILNPAPATKLSQKILSKITVLTPNKSEAEILTGIKVINETTASKAAGLLRKRGVKNVIITLGTMGSFLATEDKKLLIPTKRVKAVDTTAAGDAFNGALAYALAKGEEISEAVRFANCAGALAATKIGAQPSLPFEGEIHQLLLST